MFASPPDETSLTRVYITLAAGVLLGFAGLAGLALTARAQLLPAWPIPGIVFVFPAASLVATLFVRWRFPGAPLLMLLVCFVFALLILVYASFLFVYYMAR